MRSNWLPAVLGLIVLGVVAYVGLRAAEASRRGADPAKAAADALRDVGPPAILAGAGVILGALVAGMLGVFLVVVIIAAIFGQGGDFTGLFLILLFGGFLVSACLCGAIMWAVQRVRHSRG